MRAARRFEVKDGALEAALDQAAGTPKDPDGLTDEETNDLLEVEGLPTGANAEIAVCLLMCAQDCAAMGDRATATEMTIRARDLVGEQAALTLLQLVRDAAISEGSPQAAIPYLLTRQAMHLARKPMQLKLQTGKASKYGRDPGKTTG